jgi:hypothetical protein
MSQRWNTPIYFCNIHTKHLQHHYKTSETRRTHACNMHKSCHTPWMSPRRRDCLPASSSHPPAAQRRGSRGSLAPPRAPCAGAAGAATHREEGEEEALGGGGASGRGGRAVAHLVVGVCTTARGEPAGARRCRWRSSVCWRRRKKEEREMVSAWLFLPWWRTKRSIFSPPSGRPSPSITVWHFQFHYKNP